jgi:hypothetical protein
MPCGALRDTITVALRGEQLKIFLVLYQVTRCAWCGVVVVLVLQYQGTRYTTAWTGTCYYCTVVDQLQYIRTVKSYWYDTGTVYQVYG